MTTPDNTTGLFQLWIEGDDHQPYFHAEGSYRAMTQLMGVHQAAGRLCWLQREDGTREEGL